MNRLTRLAALCPAPVFIVQGQHDSHSRPTPILGPYAYRVNSPRHASILLVLGTIPPGQQEYLCKLHDQLPHPRATVWRHTNATFTFTESADIQTITLPSSNGRALGEQIHSVHRSLFTGVRRSEPDLNADEPPAPWREQGDHGQGGKGMMGGKPYGRAMAMSDDDIRDGLQLDALTFTIGPFMPGLPPGLRAEVTLQGDVIQRWKVESVPYPLRLHSIFWNALEKHVPVAVLEFERVRCHLRRLGLMLQADGLHQLGERAEACVERLPKSTDLTNSGWANEVRAIVRVLRWNGFLRCGRGIGILPSEQTKAMGGFVARAAGAKDDARNDSEAYQDLGFTAVCQRDGDVRARRMQLVQEIDQSLYLTNAAAANNSKVTPLSSVETPVGRLTRDQSPGGHSEQLNELLPGSEWSEAIAIIGSLPLASIRIEEASG